MSLSYVFNFSFPRINANLKSVFRLLHLVSLCFIIKQTPHLNESVPKIYQMFTFILNNHNLTHFLLLSIFEFFCNIARLKDKIGWKSLVSLPTMFHVPTRLPINIANEHTAYTRLFQLNDHQIQKEKFKRSPNFRFLCCKVIILRGVYSLFFQIWKDIPLLLILVESSLSYSI